MKYGDIMKTGIERLIDLENGRINEEDLRAGSVEVKEASLYDRIKKIANTDYEKKGRFIGGGYISSEELESKYKPSKLDDLNFEIYNYYNC